MKEHKVRIARPTDDKEENHVFIECYKDKWIEFNGVPSHKRLHEIIDSKDPICYATRAFDTIIKNWSEHTIIN